MEVSKLLTIFPLTIFLGGILCIQKAITGEKFETIENLSFSQRILIAFLGILFIGFGSLFPILWVKA